MIYHKLRVVTVTNNLEANPKYADDTKEFPHFVSYIEDECVTFIVDTVDDRFWPYSDFFHMVSIKEFIVDSEQLKD